MTGEAPAILNVDVDSSARRAKTVLLAREGFRVVEAADEEEALRLAASVRPAVALLEGAMPASLSRRIKEDPALAATLVLHLGRPLPEGRPAPEQGDADVYLSRPVLEEELLANVKALVRLRRRELENRRLLAQLQTEAEERRQAEAAQRHSEELFRAAFHQAAVGIAYADLDGRLLDANAALCTRLGFVKDDLVGRSLPDLPDLLCPEERDAASRFLAEVVADERPHCAFEGRVLRKDGAVVWVSATITAVRDANGRPARLLAIVEDVTARKAAERNADRRRQFQAVLRESLETLLSSEEPAAAVPRLFHGAAHHLDLDIYFYYVPDPGGSGIRLVSSAGLSDEERRRFEYLAYGEALCGKSAKLRAPVIVARMQESVRSDITPVKALGARAYACYPLLAGGELLGTLAFASRSRDEFDEEDLGLLRTLSQYLAVAMQRLRHSAALEASEQRYRSFIEQTSEGVWRVETDEPVSTSLPLDEQVDRILDHARLAEGNHAIARLYGYESAESLMGARLRDLFALHEPDGRRQVAEFVRHGYRLVDSEAVVIDRHGRSHTVLRTVMGTVVDGRLVRAWGTQRDITDRKRAEEALCESQSLLQTLLDHMPVAVYMKDVTGRTVLANEAYRRLTGRPLHELIGSVDHEVFPDSIARHLYEHTRRVLETGRLLQAEERLPGEGGMRTYLTLRFPLKRPDGTIYATCGIATDITDRKRAEDELRKSEERFRSFAMNAPAAVFIKDLQGRYVLANPSAAAAVGRPEGIEGLTDEQIMPDLAPSLRAADQKVLALGKAVTTEEEAIGPPGSRRSFLTVKFPLRDGGGLPTGVCGIAIDITDRVRAQELLRYSEERFRAFANQLEDVLWIITADRRVVYLSPSFQTVWGFSPTRLMVDANLWAESLHPDDRERALAALPRALAGERMESEYRIVRPDGTLRWIRDRSFPIFDEQGRVRWVGGLAQDVTERKSAEEALRDREERLRGFASELEHRVAARTEELALSEARLRALATELNLAEQRERRRIAGELHDHLAQLLVLARIRLRQAHRTLGQGAGSASLHDVDHIMEEALTYTRSLVAELSPVVLHESGLPAALTWLGEHMSRYGLTVRVDLEREQLELPDDAAVLLFQSVRELLMNVVKHAATAEASVILRVDADGTLRLTVSDRGRGCDPASRAGAPKKFGLFSIRERMRALGGGLELESAPERGTRATLVLKLDGAR